MVRITDENDVATPLRKEVPLFKVYVAPDAAEQTSKTLNSGGGCTRCMQLPHPGALSGGRVYK